MKKLLLTLITAAQLLSLSAQADILDIIGGALRPGNGRPGRPNRPDRPTRPGYSPVQCEYSDEGYEEHSRPHYSCNECLSYHGNCVESCFTEQYACRAVGIDYTGRQQAVIGYADDQYMAQNRAFETCRYNNLRNCYVERCDVQKHTVSERLCR